MRILFVLAAVLLVVVVAKNFNHPESNTDEFFHFSKFMKKYNKIYDTQAEFNRRFDNFKASLKRVAEKNAKSTGAIYDINQFSDMSREEFRQFPCGVDKLSNLPQRPNINIQIGDLPPYNPNIPAEWDWTKHGAVTPIKNQGQCGSCWAFSTVGNMEGVWFLANHTLVGLSEEQIVDCSTTDLGCGGGWPFWAMSNMMAAPYSGGIDSESSYPYTAEDGQSGNCNFEATNDAAIFTGYLNFCNENNNTCTSNQIQQLLLLHGPLSVCLDAESMEDYSSGIDNPGASCDPTQIDHCVTMVGYGTSGGQPFWKIKNSWGTTWGVSGYYFLYRDDSNNGMGQCGINRVITTALTKKA